MRKQVADVGSDFVGLASIRVEHEIDPTDRWDGSRELARVLDQGSLARPDVRLANGEPLGHNIG